MPDLFVSNNKHLPAQDKEESAAPEVLKIIPRKGRRPHIFTSFCPNPMEINFAEKEEDEKVLLFLRRHFITNVPWILISVFLIILPFALISILNILNMPIGLPKNSGNFLLMFYSLILFSYILVSYLTWFFNISLITDKRVIDIDFSNLVYKNVAATKLDLVQDASFSQIGVIRSVFDYGDVLIQTAGSLDNFDLLAVPHPEKVIEITGNLIGKEKKDA